MYIHTRIQDKTDFDNCRTTLNNRTVRLSCFGIVGKEPKTESIHLKSGIESLPGADDFRPGGTYYFTSEWCLLLCHFLL